MTALFAIPALTALASATWVIRAKSPVHQVLGLIANFISLAVLYLSLSAEFMGWVQIIVYAGAIMVLFLFVIALLTSRKDPVERATSTLKGQEGLGLGIGLVLAGLLSYAGLRAALPGGAALPEGFGTVYKFGWEMLTTHLFPFELTAFVLMVAVIGVIILVGRRQA